MEKLSIIEQNIGASLVLKKKILEDKALLEKAQVIANKMIRAFRDKKKVLFCGNGGSAADAQHLAAELSGKYYIDRPPLPSEALHVNTSYLTAVANDYSFDRIYERMIEAIGTEGDLLVGLSTSGNSKNVVRAFRKANEMGIGTIGFTGASGGKLKALSEIILQIPSKDTPRIQECHMLIGHSICEIVEKELFQKHS